MLSLGNRHVFTRVLGAFVQSAWMTNCLGPEILKGVQGMKRPILPVRCHLATRENVRCTFVQPAPVWQVSVTRYWTQLCKPGLHASRYSTPVDETKCIKYLKERNSQRKEGEHRTCVSSGKEQLCFSLRLLESARYRGHKVLRIGVLLSWAKTGCFLPRTFSAGSFASKKTC